MEEACPVVLTGVASSDRKHLIPLARGYDESWGEVIDPPRRELNQAACWIADVALWLWAAANEHSRGSAQQRRTSHKKR